MPTILTHAAFSLAVGRFIESRLGVHALAAGAVLSILPDIDVVAFGFGIPYGHPLGHRGLTHSVSFAAVMATACWLYLRSNATAGRRLWGFLFLSAVSHPTFDAFTNGGRGVALLAPFSNERFFAPFRPIEVSPIGLQGFLTRRGLTVLLSEALWICLPTAIILIAIGLSCRKRSTSP